MAIQRDDPYGAFNFAVEIDGVARAGFAEVTGLDQEIGFFAYRNGSDPAAVRLIPGLPKPATVTLRRGMTGDLEIQQWFDAARSGAPTAARRNVRVVLFDEAREPVFAWLLSGALPIRLEGPSLDAAATGVAIETLVLVAEAISVS
jgi:phage tail-like protein